MTAALKEASRKKTFVVMAVIAALFLILWGILLHFALNMRVPTGMRGLADYLMTQMGLQFASMLLVLLTIMLSAGAVSSELETGLMHGILSRPLRRAEYMLGKLLGLTLITAASATVFYTLLLVIGAVNGLSTVVSLTAGQALGGMLLFMTAPFAALCLTLWGSVYFKTVPNGILMIFIYILGQIGGMVEMVGQLLNNRPISSAGIFLSLISPFHMLYITCQNFLLPSADITRNAARMAGGLAGSGAPPSVWMYTWAAAYTAGFVLLSLRGFSNKDVT